MTIGSINSTISNSTSHYRLDLGEPGLATPASASESVLRVTSHEIGNMLRFKRMAAQEGKVIVQGGIYLNRQFVGSFLAAVSGETAAYMVDKKGEIKLQPQIKENFSKKGINQNSLTKESEENKSSTPPSLDASQGINETVILAQLFAKKEKLGNEKQKGENLDKEIKRVNEAIQKLIAQRIFKTQEKILDTIQKANSIAIKLAGFSRNSTQNTNNNSQEKETVNQAKRVLQE